MLSEIQRNESIEADIWHNASIIAIKKNGAQNIHAKSSKAIDTQYKNWSLQKFKYYM